MNIPFIGDAFEGFALAVLAFYAVLGAVRPTVKSVVSLILLPLVLVAYLLVPVQICKTIFIPKNLFALVALVMGSFVAVSLCKWVLSLFLTFVFRGNPVPGFQFWSRLAGIFFSILEGVCVLIAACWMLDYFDRLGGKKLESFYEMLNHNPIYGRVAEQDPLYRMAGARKLKYVLLAHTVPEALDKMEGKPIFQKLMGTEAIRKIRGDEELQELIKKERWFSVIKHPLLYDFMKSEEIFSIMTDDEFVDACRLSLPGYLVDEILDKIKP